MLYSVDSRDISVGSGKNKRRLYEHLLLEFILLPSEYSGLDTTVHTFISLLRTWISKTYPGIFQCIGECREDTLNRLYIRPYFCMVEPLFNAKLDVLKERCPQTRWYTYDYIPFWKMENFVKHSLMKQFLQRREHLLLGGNLCKEKESIKVLLEKYKVLVFDDFVEYNITHGLIKIAMDFGINIGRSGMTSRGKRRGRSQIDVYMPLDERIRLEQKIEDGETKFVEYICLDDKKIWLILQTNTSENMDIQRHDDSVDVIPKIPLPDI